MNLLKKVLWLLIISIITLNATEQNQLCQAFDDGIQTRTNSSKIKFINNSYLFSNPNSSLNGFKVINQNSNLSCRDVNGTTDEPCQSSNVLGMPLPLMSLQSPEVFTFTEAVNNATHIKMKKLKVKKNKDLNLTATSAIYLESLTVAKNSTLTIKAPKVVINNLQAFKKSNIKIIADTIDIKTVKLQNKADLVIESFTEDAEIDMRVEKLKLQKASVLLNNGVYHIKRVELKNRSSLKVGTSVQIVNRRTVVLNHSRINASKSTAICDDKHNPNALFIYSKDLVRVENHSTIVAMVYNDRRVEFTKYAGLKGAVSAKNRAIFKNHSKVCYTKCNLTSSSTDVTPPVITLNGDVNLTITQGQAYNELGATAVDDVDGNVSVSVSGTVDTNTVGVYTLTYTARDSANNSVSKTRTITVTAIVIVDTIPPVITLNGDANLTLTQGQAYNELGATALDDVDGNVSVSIGGSVDTATVGTYVITYSAKDSLDNSASKIRMVNIVNEHEAILEELNEILEDDSIPYTTEAEFNQTEYAKKYLSNDKAEKLERAHMLVATAIDPAPEWFTTKIDKKIIIAEAGGDYTLHLNKAREDGSIIEPVDNDKLRLIVRIQRAKNDFEYVTNVNIDEYAHWDGQGVLKIHVPDNLSKGRLIVGVRPNFDDVATTAIAERWSTFVMAEVWETKAGVKTIDESSVLFPIDNNGSIDMDVNSNFSKGNIGDKVRQKLEQNGTISLALITVNQNLQNDDLVSYIFNGQPYSGKIISIEEQGNQQLVLLKPEIFNVYNIMDGDENFMIKQGLSPENIIYREGGSLSTDINESDPVKFQKMSKMMKSNKKEGFWSVDCTKGNSVLTYKPIFSLSPMDAGLQVSVYAGKEKTECKWEANLKTLKLENMALATGGAPFVVIAKSLFGSGGEISPYGELKLTVEHAPGFGIDAGWTFAQGSNFKIVALMKTLDGLGSRDIFSELKSSKAKAEISSNLGTKLKIKAISDTGLIGKAFSYLNIEVKDIGVESKTGVKFAVAIKVNNAREVYDSGKSSEFVADISLNARIKTTHAFGFYMTMLGFDSWNDYKANLSLAKIKAEATHTFNSATDNGQGAANINGLNLNSSFLNSILPSSAGVLAPTDNLSSVFNDHSEDISYDLSECENDPDYNIEVPVIACAGWMCGKVIKPVELCKGKLTISPIIADARVNKTASTIATIVNKVADIIISIAGSPLQSTENSFSMSADSEKSLKFSKICPSSPGIYRGTTIVKANGLPFEDSVENIMVCHDDDTRGDPHIVTADGLGYDYYASGDYILSRIEGVDGYEVQARFLPGYNTSWPQAVSLSVGNDIVEIQGRKGNLGNSLDIWINGKKKSHFGSKVLKLPSGGIVAITDTFNNYQIEAITVIWPKGSQTESYGVILNVASRTDPFVHIQIARPDTFAGREQGLMGNNDGNPKNDFIRRDGQVLGVDHNMSFTELYALFGTDWLVRPYESLFRNPEAIKPQFPTDVVTLTPEQRELGEEACRALTGFYKEACIIDVGLTGSVDIVKEYYENTEDLNALSNSIITPDVDRAKYTMTVSEKNMHNDSNFMRMHYTQTLQIRKDSGNGKFILLVRPPKGATATLGNGKTNYTAEGDFDTTVTVDCTELNLETNNSLYQDKGALQLWLQDPLSGTASKLLSEVILPCIDEENIPKYSMSIDKKNHFSDSNTTNMHYNHKLHIKHQSGVKSEYILKVIPPRGFNATLPSGGRSYIGKEDMDTNVTVDCTQFNVETNSTDYPIIGSVELWLKHPLTGEAYTLFNSQKLSCEKYKYYSFSVKEGKRNQIVGKIFTEHLDGEVHWIGEKNYSAYFGYDKNGTLIMNNWRDDRIIEPGIYSLGGRINYGDNQLEEIEVEVKVESRIISELKFNYKAKSFILNKNKTRAYVIEEDSNYWIPDIYTLHIIDISNSLSPKVISSLPLNDNYSGNVSDLKLSSDENHLYIIGSKYLRIIDIIDREFPELTSELEIGSYYAPKISLSLDNQRAYIALGDKGIDIFDVGNVESPIKLTNIGFMGTLEKCYENIEKSYMTDVQVSLDGNTLYISDWGYGLQVIDISDIMNPINVFSISPEHNGDEGCSIYSSENIFVDFNQSIAVVSGTNDMGSIFYDILDRGNIKQLNRGNHYEESRVKLLDTKIGFGEYGSIQINQYNDFSKTSVLRGSIAVDVSDNGIGETSLDSNKSILYGVNYEGNFFAVDLKGIAHY